MSNLEVFCITNKKIKNLEKLNLKLVGVGKDDFPENYINTKIGKNIQNKEKFYSELVFHYWFWKNQLYKYEDNIWIGFCQKRRFWIKKESENRGVESSRIIFADTLCNDEHLSRIKCADLFLDTFNYNAHTTASAALWANIPIITKQGKSFSARVCSSLLKSLNLDDLIVKDNAEYEEKALYIAKNKDYLIPVKTFFAFRLVLF